MPNPVRFANLAIILLGIATLIYMAWLGKNISYTWFTDTDENILLSQAKNATYAEFANIHFGTFIMWQQYPLSRLFGNENPIPYRWISWCHIPLIIATLATMARRQGAGWGSIAITAYAIAQSEGFGWFGHWGVFFYLQCTWISLLCMDFLWCLQATERPSKSMGLYGLLLAITCYAYAGYAITLTIGCAAMLLIDLQARQNLIYALRHKATLYAILILLSAIMGLWLTPIIEITEPRVSIQWMYYAYRDLPPGIAGIMEFITSQSEHFWTRLWLHSRYAPSFAWAECMAILFFVGFLSRAKPRLLVALTSITGLIALIIMALTSIYAFGDPRYAMFLLGPILLTCNFGADHMLRFIAHTLRLPPPWEQKINLGIASGFLLLINLGMFSTLQQKTQNAPETYHTEHARLKAFYECANPTLLVTDIVGFWTLVQNIGAENLPKALYMRDAHEPRFFVGFENARYRTVKGIEQNELQQILAQSPQERVLILRHAQGETDYFKAILPTPASQMQIERERTILVKTNQPNCAF